MRDVVDEDAMLIGLAHGGEQAGGLEAAHDLQVFRGVLPSSLFPDVSLAASCMPENLLSSFFAACVEKSFHMKVDVLPFDYHGLVAEMYLQSLLIDTVCADYG